ncbi:hypothetical protein HMPREF0372_00131 [Flavonifractor plautii ATCC 29863]|uniref:Uncharacterized protein n=1 Tax=Flavonifractor plautii ATCC 29863 TaxID=411475 RepID=G9YKX1_FLAPL|nr:hypothetical protein HMPREF0372_00131 [Flavonifractor plautii ATCC 29863]
MTGPLLPGDTANRVQKHLNCIYFPDICIKEEDNIQIERICPQF